MIKLRGYSVFLGRIEAAITAQDDVLACALTVQGAGNDKHIVAHVVFADATSYGVDPVTGQCAPLRACLSRAGI